MLDALKFVQGAVAKRSPVPILTHFSIRNGIVKGYNGAITLCSPIPLDLDCQPKAEPFVRAIQACNDTVHLAMTAAGRLTVKSGKFKVHLDCSPEPFPDTEPVGTMHQLEPGLVAALKVLEPLIAEDASRPWARAILIKNGCLFATNNVVLAQYWTGIELPVPMAISHSAVNELIRIKIDPIAVQSDGSNSVTFHYPDGRWLRTQIVTDQWPDLDRVLNRDSNPKPIATDFFSSLDIIAPFVNDMRDVWFTEAGVTTSLSEGEGASTAVDHWEPELGWYDIGVLRMLDGLIDSIDLSLYPNPVLFFGKEGKLRGAIVGKKDANYPPIE